MKVKMALASLVGVFAPVQPIMVVSGVLIFVDLLAGVIAAHKRGERISSSGIRRTVTKAFVYQSAIISGFLIEKFMLNDYVPISKIAASLIGLVEAKSIFENLNYIYGGNIFKKVLTALGSVNDTEEEKKKEVKPEETKKP